MFDLVLIRAAFLLLVGTTAWFLPPLGLSPFSSLLLGIAIASGLVLAEIRLRTVSLKRLLGAALGFLSGLLAALLVAVVLKLALPPSGPSLAFLQLTLLLALPFLGLQIGSTKGELLDLSVLGGLVGGEKSSQAAYKILDTSVIIDGRVAEILETGFLDGTIVIPQFVLRELQMVADSSDALKRNRGRRGLDILQRLQKSPKVTVQIVEQDFPQIREVDLKLIELAKLFSSKIVTNDFNLNKVAQLQGVQVLNINELANSLRPVVLPGELMRVFIVKEGKEASQGVAYLDDGTMVVVDNARKMISKTIDIAVTSVLQTTAGKMIFGRFDDRLHAVHEAKQEKAG